MSAASRRDEMMADMMAQIAEQRATLEALMHANTGKGTSVRDTPTNISSESGHLGAVEVSYQQTDARAVRAELAKAEAELAERAVTIMNLGKELQAALRERDTLQELNESRKEEIVRLTGEYERLKAKCVKLKMLRRKSTTLDKEWGEDTGESDAESVAESVAESEA